MAAVAAPSVPSTSSLASLDARWHSSIGIGRLDSSKALQIDADEQPRDLRRARISATAVQFYYPDLPRSTCRSWQPLREVAGLSRRQFRRRMRDEALRHCCADHELFSPYVVKGCAPPQAATSHGMLDNPDWGSCDLWRNGQPVAVNAARCPSIFSAAAPTMSAVRRRQSIADRRSSRSGRVRVFRRTRDAAIAATSADLPPSCRRGCEFRGQRERSRRVGNEGKLLAFDDSVEHEAWNRSSEEPR